MSKFGDAFKRGQDAHQNAERAKEEIRDVFRVLAKDIEQQTRGLVTTSVMQFANLRKILGASAVGPGVSTMLPSENKYDALVAMTGDERPVQLCTVKWSPHGYPVVLTFPGHSVTAHDRESLEDALADVIAHPNIAGKLKVAMESAKGAGPSQDVPARE